MNSLKYLISTIFILISLFGCSGYAEARGVSMPPDAQQRHADSIMRKVVFFAPLYEHIVNEYHAQLYIKGRVNVKKKNHLLRFMPSMFRLRKGVNEYMTETYSDLHFTAPNIYDQKVKAAVGTASEFWQMDGRLPDFFNINIYSPSLLYDKLLSPLAPNAFKYYTYRLDSVYGPSHHRLYRIHFIPKNKSYQLVGGYMVVSSEVWSIREMRFSGRNEMLSFSNHVWMGDVGADNEFLPLGYQLDGTFHFLGNLVDGSYTAILDYQSIVRGESKRERILPEGKSRFDLTESYTLRTDTNVKQTDTAYFNTIRPLRLNRHEDSLYVSYFERRADTVKTKKRHRAVEFWGEIGDALISRYTVNFSKYGSVRCSPLINPFLLSYSASNGFSYRQEFKYNRFFSGDRLLRIVPRIGYNFKQKAFYWKVDSRFDYLPEHNVWLTLDVGRGNRIYSSEVLDDLEAIPDSIFDFNQIHLDYFDDHYLKLTHSWEMMNGLTLDLGLSLHRRTEVERSRFVLLPPAGDGTGNTPAPRPGDAMPGFDPSLLSKFRHAYNTFAPRVRLTYTPRQYYYMHGRRKVNLYSHSPSFSVEWERGLDHVIDDSGSYERIEMDMQQSISLGLMRNFYWRAGWGTFTKQENVYFVDFANLRQSNLPTGWNEDISGMFQLLDGRWYNSSRSYLRAHATYEAPFLLINHLNKVTRFVLNERVYLNALTVPHLRPYLELGYGIGTHVFDFGLFASLSNWEFDGVGCKFTFELFNR